MRPLFAFLSFLLLGLAAPSAAIAQTAPVDTSLLAESGVIFPERLGKFVRLRISSVGTGRIGASYVLPPEGPGSPVADIFLARVYDPLPEELARTEQLIGSNFQDLAPVRELRAPRGAPGAVGRLWSGSIGEHRVLTGVILYHRRGWRIKVRATVDAVGGEAAWSEVEKMMDAFDWNGPGA
jgi:hypothetical protein